MSARTRTVGRLLLGGSLGLYVLLELYALHPTIGDHNIYFYMARRTLEGLVPYLDFDFAHPPFHLAPMLVVEWIGGGSFLALKALAPLWTLGTGLSLYGIARHPRTAATARSGVWAALACALYLLNFDVLRMAGESTGANQATFFLAAGWLLALHRRGIAAGLCYAASFSTALFVAPLVAAGWGLATAGSETGRGPDRRELTRTIGSSAMFFGLIHLPVWILAPADWWRQTVLFHLKKPAVGRSYGEVLFEFLGNGGLLLACTLGLAVVLALARERDRAAWLPVSGLAYLLVLSPLSSPFLYYFSPAFPLLALATVSLLARLAAGARDRRVAALKILAVFLVAASFQYACYVGRPAVRKNRGVVARHVLRPTPAIGPLNGPLAALAPDEQVVGRPYPGVVRYLWNEGVFWHDARALADEVRRVLPQDAVLYGDSTTTPLLALFSERRLACDLADTNGMQFATGNRDIEDDLDCLRRAGNVLIFVQPGRGVHGVARFREFLERETSPFRVLHAAGRTLEVYWHYPGSGRG
jgi:hypothetical protein